MEDFNFTDLATFKSGILQATANRLKETEAEVELLRSLVNRKSDSDNTDIFETDVEKIKAFENITDTDLFLFQIPMSVAIVMRTPYQKIDNQFVDLYAKIASGVKLTPPMFLANSCGLDGGHRLTLAYLLGLKEIPILFATYKPKGR